MVLGVLIAVGEALSPGTYTNVQFTWLHLPPAAGPFPNGFSLVMGTLVDPLSSLMLVVVTVVGFLVMLYSIGYMHHDRGLPRYYAELSLFLASMTGLVLANNLLEFFLFWELVGVCSYFLIGFYYEKPSAASAAKEAFLVTRVGDILFLLGIFLYFSTYSLAGPAGSGGWAANGFVFANGSSPFLSSAMGGNSTILTIAGLLILGGAAGKSAQFPLHVWLPDAMEGPTTVSALIHAATMVAAGVYLLAIASVFLGFTPTDQLAIVAIGG
ncbi:MAG: proton-conducting transporter membrane subunit, partial [Thermoplasmata archaeon]